MNNFGLYIHWPFCKKKCPYCNFNTYTFEHNQKDWINALLQELEQYKTIFPNYTIDTIFFGGGTPSLIPPEFIKLILDKAYSLWSKNNYYVETTIETNPSKLETHKLDKFLESGINRFSIGIQSINDENLQFLGRLHSAQEAVEILTYACNICENTSADFMYALPNQTLSSWKKELAQIIDLAYQINLKHISLYQLTIEENTPFFSEVQSKKWSPASNKIENELYRHTHKELNKKGWNFYEISNASKKEQFQAKHNLKYWNYENYLGIGPGAHSRMILNEQKFKFNNILNPFKWKAGLDENAKSLTFLQNLKQIEDISALNEKEQFVEKLMLNTRLNKAFDLDLFCNEYINFENLEFLRQQNFVQIQNNQLWFNLKGKLLLNSILKYILN